MSWIKTNYHLAALGGGVLALGGLGFAGYSGNSEVNESLVAPTGRGKNVTTCEGGPLAAGVVKTVGEVNPLLQRKTTDGRPVNLFTSVDLYTRVGQPNKLLDILKEPPVHPPIDNIWWVKNNIDMTWNDSPYRDPDGDGFNNRNEFDAGTDPNDPKSVGDLLSKLEVAAIEKSDWRLLFNNKTSDGAEMTFLYVPFGGRRAENKLRGTEAAKVDDTIFAADPGKGRFKLVKLETKNVQMPTGPTDRWFATFEDLSPNKKGTTYVLPADPRKSLNGINEIAMCTYADYTIVFRLNAVGEEGNWFKVPENTTFSLPAGGADKDYKASMQLSPDRKPVAVIVEFTKDGKTEKKTLSIPQ